MRKTTRRQRLVMAVAASALVVGGLGLASAAPVQAADQYLDGVYRIDFNGARQMYNTIVAPTADTSATYRFSTTCAGEPCVAAGALLSSSQEAVIARPSVTLYWVGLAWRLEENVDTPCPDGAGTRSQKLMWALTPTPGSDVIAGQASVKTTSMCRGDARGVIVQTLLATPET